jgi:hypothetical protein
VIEITTAPLLERLYFDIVVDRRMISASSVSISSFGEPLQCRFGKKAKAEHSVKKAGRLVRCRDNTETKKNNTLSFDQE